MAELPPFKTPGSKDRLRRGKAQSAEGSAVVKAAESEGRDVTAGEGGVEGASAGDDLRDGDRSPPGAEDGDEAIAVNEDKEGDDDIEDDEEEGNRLSPLEVARKAARQALKAAGEAVAAYESK